MYELPKYVEKRKILHRHYAVRHIINRSSYGKFITPAYYIDNNGVLRVWLYGDFPLSILTKDYFKKNKITILNIKIKKLFFNKTFHPSYKIKIWDCRKGFNENLKRDLKIL